MAEELRHRGVRPEELLGFSLPARRDGGVAPRDAGRLLRSLAKAKLDWGLLAPHVLFDPRGYVRSRLFCDAAWEVLLLAWLPGQATAVHDHGGSWGAVRILSGSLIERRWRWRGEGRRMPLACEQACDAPGVVEETLDTVHRNENRSDAPAVSLHLYSPPLTVINSYDPKAGARHAVTMRRGASAAVGGNPRLRPGRVPVSARRPAR